MLSSSEKVKQEIIDEVIQRITAKLPANEAVACIEFVRQFYIAVSPDDFEGRNVEDVYGTILNFWDFIKERQSGELKLRVYNPEYEKHGWQSTHTIVEVITDDMPFLVDSLTMELNRLNLTVYLAIHMGGLKVCRDKHHHIDKVLPRTKKNIEGCEEEAPIYFEINRQTDPAVLEQIKYSLKKVLEDVRKAVTDWRQMRERVKTSVTELQKSEKWLNPEDFAESVAFLKWIEDDHFTFLGIRDYQLAEEKGEPVLNTVPETGLGILSNTDVSKTSLALNTMTPAAREFGLARCPILIISKTNHISDIHRPIYMDYIGIKLFNEQGQVIGERRIIGLFTSIAYNTSPRFIPLLRHKVATIIEQSGVGAKSHAGKALLHIIETLPRDDLFQASTDELLKIAMGIFQIQERRMIRMFARKDIYDRFVSCLVYVPRDRYNTELRIHMEKILKEAFHAREITFATQFTDSVLARIHFLIRLDRRAPVDYNYQEIEAKLVEASRTWGDELHTTLIATLGEEKGNTLSHTYLNSFSASYRENFSSRTAVYDIKHIGQLSEQKTLELNFYHPIDASEEVLKLKIYRYDETIVLSDVVPILENMGLRVISERPYKIIQNNGRIAWINDFSLQALQKLSIPLEEIKEIFQEAFAKVWFEDAENDGFNKLILATGLNWREVEVLRAYAKYLRQAGFTFSQEYIEKSLNNNPEIAKDLMLYFLLRFNPDANANREEECLQLKEKLLQALDNVSSLDEDRIIRRYIDLISATLRTSYFQTFINHNITPYLSFKLEPKKVPELPWPIPMFEIFVYSPQFEGVHLRGGKVARGGLRWSDRPEDFRTEVLGLIKAQQVKNALIVPTGAKGGFVPKRLPRGDRDAIFAEGTACYKNFIRGLLNLTDNLVAGKVVKPKNTICYDEDDTYLVVAADKGTATFSDTANAIAKEYQFWLKDAFASGGSAGYDHKKMGITARGAWECVKRSFRELGINIDKTDFTVIGIGDMAGDVFGNGVLYTPHIKLVGAFNHMHIFLDPNPNPEASFKERQRLFDLPRSTWKDYDASLISPGGGIFERSAKFITLSPEIKALLNLQQDTIVPNDLIRAMLRAPVDLLWNGGIGTFVKARTESNIEVGDRTNDGIRINGDELSCKVIGEGGNLGFTQLGRVEYALREGMIYTDFIDNSGGVNCSDLEVNIKILLNYVMEKGDLTEKQRDELLVEMTEEVAKIVLYNNYQQSQAISIAALRALRNIELHRRYLHSLEQSGKLVRAQEFLPDDKALLERKLLGKGLTKPGLSVLLAYSKMIAKEEILNSDLPEDTHYEKVLENAFPEPLRLKFLDAMKHHPLKREIIATQLCNRIFNEMGFTFTYRLGDETGAAIPTIVRAYTVTRSIFDLANIWQALEALDNRVESNEQMLLMIELMRLVRRSTRWLLRNRRLDLNIASCIQDYAAGIQTFKQCLPDILSNHSKESFNAHVDKYLGLGIPSFLSQELASIHPLYSALDVLTAAKELQRPIQQVAKVYFAIGDVLDMDWIRLQIIEHIPENHWEALSREALRDDLDWQQRSLTIAILHNVKNENEDAFLLIDAWAKKHTVLITRWRNLLIDLRASSSLTVTMFFATIRELLDLTLTSLQATNGKS